MARATEVLGTNHLQGVPPKGQQHQYSITNDVAIVHRCVVCLQETRVIWRANGICIGHPDLFQDFKGGPKVYTLENRDD